MIVQREWIVVVFLQIELRFSARKNNLDRRRSRQRLTSSSQHGKDAPQYLRTAYRFCRCACPNNSAIFHVRSIVVAAHRSARPTFSWQSCLIHANMVISPDCSHPFVPISDECPVPGHSLHDRAFFGSCSRCYLIF